MQLLKYLFTGKFTQKKKKFLLGVNTDIDADLDSVLLKMYDPSSYISTVTVKMRKFLPFNNTDNRNCTERNVTGLRMRHVVCASSL